MKKTNSVTSLLQNAYALMSSMILISTSELSYYLVFFHSIQKLNKPPAG